MSCVVSRHPPWGRMRSGGSCLCGSIERISPLRTVRLPSQDSPEGSPTPNKTRTCHMAASRVPPGCHVKWSKKSAPAAALAPLGAGSAC